ncbi:DUF1990 family protein [Pseudonocardia sp. H11422]|uniref:DUF1990 family protein n=1 Tax=Pseudonocardia sp. H11422 TaxID=2835866 RepID=UPI0039774344
MATGHAPDVRGRLAGHPQCSGATPTPPRVRETPRQPALRRALPCQLYVDARSSRSGEGKKTTHSFHSDRSSPSEATPAVVAETPARDGPRANHRGNVWFSIRGFSGPTTWCARIGAPVTRLVRRRITAMHLQALTRTG